MVRAARELKRLSLVVKLLLIPKILLLVDQGEVSVGGWVEQLERNAGQKINHEPALQVVDCDVPESYFYLFVSVFIGHQKV